MIFFGILCVAIIVLLAVTSGNNTKEDVVHNVGNYTNWESTTKTKYIPKRNVERNKKNNRHVDNSSGAYNNSSSDDLLDPLNPLNPISPFSIWGNNDDYHNSSSNHSESSSSHHSSYDSDSSSSYDSGSSSSGDSGGGDGGGGGD